MKNVFTLFLILLTLKLWGVTPMGGHYRWYQDGGTVALAAEDTPITVTQGDKINLRLEFYDTYSATTNSTTQTESTYLDLMYTGGNNSETLSTTSTEIKSFDSPFYNNGDPVTADILTTTTSSNPFFNPAIQHGTGVVFDNTSGFFFAYPDNNGNYSVECIYAIEITSNAVAGATYSFESVNYSEDQFPSFTVQAALPVELLNFDAKYQNELVRLNWNTASEINNDYFILEKSFDAVNWEEISTIDGHGNSVEIQKYGFTDHSPAPGLNYYRLKQVDFDKTETISKTINVNIAPTKGIVSLAPNPTSGLVNLKFIAPKEQIADIRLFSLNGEHVLSFKQEVVKGENKFTFDTSVLPNGIYNAVMLVGNEQFQEKLVVTN